MSTPAYYLIIRRATPTDSHDKDRFLSLGYGWTTNRDMAKRFDTRSQAKYLLHGRPGEIVGVDEAREVLP